MYKIYKHGMVELSQESFAVKADMPPPPRPVAVALKEGEQEQLIGDNTPVTLDPQMIEELLDDARRQAAQIVNDARVRAADEAHTQRLKAEKEIAQLRQMVYEEAYSEAQARGYTEGAAAKVAAIEQTIAKLEEAIAGMEGRQSGFIAEYESDLRWAVCAVSTKVLGRIIERDELELVETVKAAVEQVKNADWINLHLCGESVELIDRLQRELAPLRQLEIVPDDLPAGSCILDLPTGKLDASIDAQMENLKDYFRSRTLEL